jgi:cyclopropane-fatty-acyl-phospholipid synthase
MLERLFELAPDTLRRRLTLDVDQAHTLIERIFADHPDKNFAVRMWDGSEVGWETPRDFVLEFSDPEVFRECLAAASPARLAEAYVTGRVRVEGDFWEAARLGNYLRDLDIDASEILQIAPRLAVAESSHSPDEDRRDVRGHYDRSNPFFALFLDERMVYSSGYFASAEQSLEEAQTRKLELICQKLQLEPGEDFLDLGCGWGALLIWAAEHHGVQGRGVTLSTKQAAWARRRIDEKGLGEQVTVDLMDYRELPADRFDKIASIGMYEHVGLTQLATYMEAVARTLRPGGLFLNQGVTMPWPMYERIRTGGSFISKYVFPGTDMVPVSLLQEKMERAGFEVLDVQSLRRDYARTLRRWYRRYQQRRSEAAEWVDEQTLRVWDVYLAGCAHAFEQGLIGDHQILAGAVRNGG